MTPKVIFSKRKSVAISLNDYGSVVVRAPRGVCIVDINKFVIKNNDWIIKQKERLRQKQMKLTQLNYDDSQKKEYKSAALENFTKIAEKLTKQTGIKYKKLKLSNAKKRWGSCNSKKRILINWKLHFVPQELQEYVILHELSHIKHMNHSKKFWFFIEKHMADFIIRRKKLKEYEYLLLLD